MTSAMVPVFAQVLERDGKSGAFAFFSQVFLRLLITLLILALLVMLLIGAVVSSGLLSPEWALAVNLRCCFFPMCCLSVWQLSRPQVWIMWGVSRLRQKHSILLNLAIIASLLVRTGPGNRD